MTLKPLYKMKRIPVSVGILLSSVVFAGIVSNVIEAPVGSYEYLHEHLISSASGADQRWVGRAFTLPVQDREKLSTIITELEQWLDSESIRSTRNEIDGFGKPERQIC